MLNRQIKLMTKHRKDRRPAGVTHAYGGRHKGHTTAATHAHDGRRMGRKTREKRKWERRKTGGKGYKKREGRRRKLEEKGYKRENRREKKREKKGIKEKKKERKNEYERKEKRERKGKTAVSFSRQAVRKKEQGGSPLQTDCTKQGKEAAHIKRQGFYPAARLHHENRRQNEALPSFWILFCAARRGRKAVNGACQLPAREGPQEAGLCRSCCYGTLRQ